MSLSERDSRNFVVRAALASDVAEIAQLVEQFAGLMLELGDESPLRLDARALESGGFGPDPAFRGIVAESEGRVVGYLLYHQGYDTDTAVRLVVVIDLFVSAAARRQGVGAALLNEARLTGAAMGAKAMIWTVDSRNTAAQRFYERCGARVVDGSVTMGMPV